MITTLVLTAPWLLGLAWALFRHGLGDSDAPSMGESAARRLSAL